MAETKLLERSDVVGAVDEPLARLEAELRFRGWQVARRAERWDRAFDRMSGLVDILRDDTDRATMGRLLYTGLEAASRANSRGAVGRFVRRVAPRSRPLGFDELAPIFAICAEMSHDALGEEIGDALVRSWPDSAVGWFTRADASERRAERHRWRPEAEWADDFARARELGSEAGAQWQRQLTVRWIVAHLRVDRPRATIRDALKSLDLTDLDPSEKSWLALGLAHSGHWLDQVRACDLIDLTLDALERRAQPPDSALVAATGALFARLPPRPNDVVVERLTSLLEHRSMPERAERWRAALERRRSNRQAIDSPLREGSQSGGTPALLAAAYRGSAPDSDTFVGRVARAIASPTADALDELRRSLVRTDPPQWRAIGALWPRLFEEGDDTLIESVDRLGRAWAERAPKPSYGWWSLAANAIEFGAQEAAQAFAWRGLRETPHHDIETRDVVLGKILSRLVREAEVSELREWLEAIERVVGEDDDQSSGSKRPGK